MTTLPVMISYKFAKRRARMRWISLTASVALVLLQLPLSSSLADAQVSADKPDIEWPGLTLGDFSATSLADWRNALSEPWILEGEPTTFLVGSDSDRREVGTCDEIFAVEQNIGASGPDRRILKAWLATCRAIQILVDGTSPAGAVTLFLG